MPRAKSKKPERQRRHKHSWELKLRVAKLVVEEGATRSRVAAALHLPTTTVAEWTKRYVEGGAEALQVPEVTRVERPPSASAEHRRRAVTSARVEHPEWGTRRIRDVLARFEAIGVSETDVRRILHEAGLLETRPPTPERAHPERRFERAEPNQLWQSDIFTFLLRRQQRVYLAGFMDDHSRFLVSYALAHHQRSELVMEALRKGIATYGAPREMLTDNGRQYTAWRGETDFERELRSEGIRHVKSRPQHPQTLGKIERFWKTLWEEFLSRTVFADFADCDRRLGLYVQAYNFQRPHQALEGLVPADRFFRAAPQVRAAVEKSVTENAMRMAQEQPPRKPFYLVGRLGDRDLSIAAEGSGLRVQVGTEAAQTIELPKKEDGDEANQASRFKTWRGAEEASASAPSHVPYPEVAPRPEGPRRDGAAPVPDDPERAQWGALRDRGRGSGGDYAERVLPDGDESGARDGGGAGPWGERGRVACAPPGAARGEDRAVGAGQAPTRAAAVSDAPSGETRPSDAAPAGPSAGPRNELGARWAQVLAELTGEGEAAEQPFDAELGWRDRVLQWDRKLTSADAPSDPDGRRGDDEQEDLLAGARGAGGAARALRNDARCDERGDDGERRGASTGDVAQSLPDPAPSRAGIDDRWDSSGGAGPAREAGEASGAGERGGEAPAREHTPEGTSADDRPDHGGRGGDDP
jgi:transposase InsO family protein